METEKVPREVEAMVIEAHTLGLIEFADDERFKVTEKGIERAQAILDKLPLLEQFMVMIAVPEIMDTFFEENKEDRT